MSHKLHYCIRTKPLWYWLVRINSFFFVWRKDFNYQHSPDSKVHGANKGPIWGRQDPGGYHVGPMNFAIWVMLRNCEKCNPCLRRTIISAQQGLSISETVVPGVHWQQSRSFKISVLVTKMFTECLQTTANEAGLTGDCFTEHLLIVLQISWKTDSFAFNF